MSTIAEIGIRIFASRLNHILITEYLAKSFRTKPAISVIKIDFFLGGGDFDKV